MPDEDAPTSPTRTYNGGRIPLDFPFMNMNPQISHFQMTRAEQEAETEARRLESQIEQALAAVAVRTNTDADGLEACANGLERAARDMVVALRELARERRLAREEAR